MIVTYRLLAVYQITILFYLKKHSGLYFAGSHPKRVGDELKTRKDNGEKYLRRGRIVVDPNRFSRGETQVTNQTMQKVSNPNSSPMQLMNY